MNTKRMPLGIGTGKSSEAAIAINAMKPTMTQIGLGSLSIIQLPYIN